nr:metallophosphoesterase [Bacteroidota bacterium]
MISKNRKHSQYKNLGHSDVGNYFRKPKKTRAEVDAENKIGQFFTEGLNKIVWLFHYLKHRFGPKAAYPKYDTTNTGVHTIVNHNHIRTTVGLVFDWATDTYESDVIASNISSHHPHYTIHGGDTYFVGDDEEIYENFLAPHSSWHRGSHGSFAIAGNHEMYSKGHAFYKNLLPSLGIKNNDGKFDGQQAGYFCLQNDHWRIIGLDTGYNSIGKIPIIEMLPWFAPDCQLHNDIILWLQNVVKINDKNDKRGIVIITHHPYFTTFKGKSDTIAPAIQLASIIGTDKPIIWLWGHEHKLSLYAKHQLDGGVTCYGRCMGHGGMPVELEAKHFVPDTSKPAYKKLIAYDNRNSNISSESNLGYNGYAMLDLEKEKLTIKYYDIERYLLAEEWKHNMDGTIEGRMIVDDFCPLSTMNDKEWGDAVK